MVGRTLGVYMTAKVAKGVFGALGVIFSLIFIVDFIETLRRSGNAEDVSAATLLAISFLRTPSIVEQTIPFAMLFGAMVAFLGMSRRLELVVIRASGVSAWQFLAPIFALAIAIGLAASLAFNPLAAIMKAQCDAMEAALSGASRADNAEARWLRQKSADGQAVIRASRSAEGGVVLGGATFFNFSPNGQFENRVEAREARLRDGYWELQDARLLSPDREPEPYGTYQIATNLTVEQVRQTFEKAETVPFWSLPAAIRLATAAGLDANKYLLQYQTLMARPMLLLAMAMIAATVSLRFFRFGGVGPMIAGGVAAGFVLYVVSQMAGDLGSAGMLNPSLAAWTPAVVGTLFGVAMLLKQEDG
jgi:lipopolysaccharide export system permease protein